MKTTKSMQKFLKEDVTPDYILYSKADKYAFCTHCQHEVDLDFKGTRPKAEVTCPSCKRKAILKAKGQTKNAFFDFGVGIILENIDSYSLIVRYFDVEKTYKKDGTLADVDIKECMRQTFDNDGLAETWDNSWTYGWRKCNVRQYGNWKGAAGEPVLHINDNWKIANVYTKNLKEVIKGTAWEYSCMDSIFKQTDNFTGSTVSSFLKSYLSSPIDEYLYKVGFKRLLDSSLHCNLPCYTSKETLPQMLSVDSKNWKALLANGNPTVMELVKRQRMTQYNFSEEEYEIFEKYLNDRQYYYYRPNSATEYDDFKKVFPKTLKQFAKYADSQDGFKLKFYMDYLNLCKELKYDLNNTFVLFPKDLKLAHDMATEHFNRKKEQKKKREFNKQKKSYLALKNNYIDKFSFEENNLQIVVPEDCDAILREGQKLHHCVGTYVSKVANGTSIILFVRRINKTDEPYYTMEIQGDEMIQCRGFSNKHCTREVHKFIKDFAKKKKLMMRDIA